ncbi:MAG: chromosome segregation protein SMC [Nitrospirae bacterium]|nr:chromosome segregation protein SMC [Nitrospirota bacterium]
MRLRKLEILGFKTFPEKTTLHIQHGITCIVGPNGCGKSNIVDALLWVMGEQSTKTLRGEKMEDVIFFGSDSRKSIGMSEVTITIGDLHGELTSQYSEYSEIEVTRRLFRSGESEYLINKVPCRLKDIRDILIDAGVGFKGHTVIEQGRVERILTSTPEDRRAIIEDTAGIMKYKFRKTEALRKLESTQHNLLRVRDIVSEVKRQINSLDRQVRKAREYQELAAKIKEQELLLTAVKYTGMDNDLKALLLKEEGVREAEMKNLSELAGIEAESEETKSLLLGDDRKLNELRGTLNNLDKEISESENKLIVIENQITHQREDDKRLHKEITELKEDIITLKASLESLSSEKLALEEILSKGETGIAEAETKYGQASHEFSSIQERLESARSRVFGTVGKVTEVKNKQNYIQSRIFEINRRKERITSEKEENSNTISGTIERMMSKEESERHLNAGLAEKSDSKLLLSEQLAVTENSISGLTDKLNSRRELLHRSEARFHSLEEMEKNLVGYQEGVRTILLSKSKEGASFQGIQGIVADFFDVKFNLPPLQGEGWGGDGVFPDEKTAEMVIESVLGDRLQNIVVEGHENTEAAIAYLKTNSAGRTTFIPSKPRPNPLPLGERVRVRGSSGENGIIGPALAFVDYKEEYKPLVEHLLSDVVVVDNLKNAITLWNEDNNCTFVTLDGEIVEPSGRITGGTSNGKSPGLIQKRKELKTLQNEVIKLKRETSELEGELENLKQDKGNFQQQIVELNDLIRKDEIAIVNIEKDIHVLKDDEKKVQLRLETLLIEENEINSEIVSLSTDLNKYETEIQGLVTEQSAGEKEIQELIEIQKTARLHWEEAQREITSRKLEITTSRERRDAISHRIKEIEGRIEIAVRSIDEKGLYLNTIGQKIDSYNSEKTEIESAITILWQKKETLSKEIVSMEDERAHKEEGLNISETGIKEKRNIIDELKQILNQCEVQKTEIRLQMTHLCETIFNTYQLALEEEIKKLSTEEINTEEMTGALTALKERVNRMGPINMASIEEYQELNQRYEFLTTQEADLTQACETLHETISKINKTTKEMFLTTFNIINEKFQNLFQMFFQGGSSRLVLTDESNVLDSGIEIFAQPPGKKVSQLALLSGGEKALTALSLIFATFLARPTPFCVLDEIDAPLDEGNTERFINTLRDMTAFSQFIVITHNKRTMEAGDTLYGITMEEPGVSRIVSVNLTRREEETPMLVAV